MKFCSSCGAKYSDWIDFCFEDGAILAVEAAAPASETSAIDAPMPRHLRAQDAQDTPQPKSGRRRSLLGSSARDSHEAPRAPDAESILDVPPPPPSEAPAPTVRTAQPTNQGGLPSAWTGADIAARHAAPPVAPLAPVAAPPPAQPVAEKPAPPPEPVAPKAAAPPPAPAPKPEPTAAPMAAAPAAPEPEPDDEDEKAIGGSSVGLFVAIGVVGLLAVVGVGGVLVVGLGLGGLKLSGGAAEKPATVATAPAADAAPDVPTDGTATVASTDPVVAPPVATPDPVVAVAPVETEPVAVPPPAAVVGTADPVKPVPAPPIPVESHVPPVEHTGTAAPVVTAPAVGTAAAEEWPIAVSGTPPGATITVNGAVKGTAPLTFTMPPGDYKVDITKTGFSAQKKSVSVRGTSATVAYELWEETQVGKLIVAIQGKDGQTLLVDGLPMGKLPATIDLTEGSHTFAVQNGDGTVFSVTKDVAFTNGRAFLNL